MNALALFLSLILLGACSSSSSGTESKKTEGLFQPQIKVLDDARKKSAEVEAAAEKRREQIKQQDP